MAEVLESIKSLRGNSFFFLMSDEYRGSKDNPLPMYELVLHANCTVAHIFGPQLLLFAGFEQLKWRKTGQ